MRKIDINSLHYKVLLYNLYLTQIISLVISFILYYLLEGLNPLKAVKSVIIPENLSYSLLYGLLFAIIIIIINIILTKTLPEDMLDDGGINDKLFRNIPIWHIAIIALLVGFIEEFLFRGAIQSSLGVILTSVIFTGIHFRYLEKLLLIIVTFIISLGLGYLALYAEWFAAFIAHFLIDFVLGVMIRKDWLKK